MRPVVDHPKAVHVKLSATDRELCDLIATGSPRMREGLLAELVRRTYNLARTRRGLPKGTCDHDRRVYADVGLVMATGYTCHARDHSTCDVDVKWDDNPYSGLMSELSSVTRAREFGWL